GFLSAAAQNRNLLLSYQGLAAHRHPLRQTRSKFPCRRDPHRRTLLDQAVSPDPNIFLRIAGASMRAGDSPQQYRLSGGFHAQGRIYFLGVYAPVAVWYPSDPPPPPPPCTLLPPPPFPPPPPSPPPP